MDTSTCAVTSNGIPHIQWIYQIFGDCVYGWQECLSLLLGYLSIVCWLNAQMPQVIKNYRLQDAQSLSFSFLTVWLTGDVANFIGCLITGQLPFQTFLSIYFITIDTLLCIQWLYYVRYPNNALRRLLNPHREFTTTTKANEDTPLMTSTQKNYKTTALLMFGLLSFGVTTSSPSLTTAAMASTTVTTTATTWMVDKIWIGRFSAWLCTFLYLTSRLPQIVQNFRRRSVNGLSMALFFFAAMGNLTYTLSIFTNPHATRASLIEAVPYILGSAGTLMFDASIFIQYHMYNQRPQPTHEIKIQAELA
ncbi:PQ loop repeat-domain-containing protein [Radiomyces spectabilis]|uniref:PQ loop repeat-domain-containing protein n=1 Tax=Radiomyces spectabilis TaxID=64574 RepID=UPI0022208B89|nr:PQ loop repeat-domain-containing protein [Radiomyces spectabilis]KAI8372743.1 PQ loop repeat-domain-containing protein [Radiomyces spectabilis]